ncbi:hypothetical protein A15G_03211 [Escherichia coli KTE203]|nr:hypothetical protein A15G_03211 [Escherichia coli KTE203]
MSGKRYPEEFKTEAVKQVVDRGYSVASVATRLDITTHSLYAWIPDLICSLSASRRLSSSHYCLFIVPKRDLLNQGLRR